MIIAFVGPVPPTPAPQPPGEPQGAGFAGDIWEVLLKMFGLAFLFGLIILWEHWLRVPSNPYEEEELFLGVLGICTLTGMAFSFACMALAYMGMANEPTMVWAGALVAFVLSHAWAFVQILRM